MNRSLLLLAGLSLGAGCGTPKDTGKPSPVSLPPAQQVQSLVTLVPFNGCSELETFVQDTAVKQLQSESYGWGVRGGFAAEDSAAPQATKSTAAGNGAPAHSETNTQVAGVDEADFVKTDGNRTFYLQGRRLFVMKTWPAADSAILSTTEVEGYPQEMFLTGTKLVVFSGVPVSSFDPHVPAPDASGRTDIGAPVKDAYYPYGWSDGTKVAVYDVASDTPSLTAAWYLGGSYATSRRVDDQVRIVLRGELRWPELKYPSWGNMGGDLWGWQQADVDLVRQQNEAAVRARPIAEWLPHNFRAQGNNKVELPVDCASFHHGTGDSRLGLATVLTLDLSTLADVGSTNVVSEVGQIYSSKDNLYVAAPHYWWDPQSNDGGQFTYLHKFDVSGKGAPVYRASGVVPGTLIDQFSLGENAGYLQVASSDWKWERTTGQSATENRVYVLGEVAGALGVMGKTEPIAPGESIYSSRFEGDRGFVVTFRQIDPLFTLDLKDPKNPKVVGELQIPGVSTYIHMLDDTHLLTIGEDTNGNMRAGVSLQIFDVTNLAAPKQTAKQVIGTRSGYSDAQWDHKAFNYFEKTGVLAVPFADWSPSPNGDWWGLFTSQLKLFKVDAQGGITSLGGVDHADLYRAANYQQWDWWYMPYVRRSVQIEDYVYSFSYAGMKVNRVADLSAVKTVVVPVEGK